MTVINLTTEIKAEINKCFDMARSIDLHMISASHTNEKAVAGKTSGLCEAGDIIIWEAIHFGIKQHLTSKITKMNYPFFFEDKMLKGAFKSMRHEHHFKEENGKTIMVDHFYYEVPFGIIGWLFDKIILKKHMTHFLITRNKKLKEMIENNNYKL